MKAITSILHVWGFCSSALYSIAIQSVKCDCKQSIGSLKVQVLLQERQGFHFSLLDKVLFYWENRKVTWETITCPQETEEIQEYGK